MPLKLLYSRLKYTDDNINTKTMLNFKGKIASSNIYEKLDKQISSNPNNNSWDIGYIIITYHR